MTNQAEKALQRTERAQAQVQEQARQIHSMKVEIRELEGKSKTLLTKAEDSHGKEQ